jgi:hypothetical protein
MNTKARPAPKFANPGRLARFSYVTTDKSGTPVRRWHVNALGDCGSQSNNMLDPKIAKSLVGMVRV